MKPNIRKHELLEDWYEIVAHVNDMSKDVAMLELDDDIRYIRAVKAGKFTLNRMIIEFFKKVEKIRLGRKK